MTETTIFTFEDVEVEKRKPIFDYETAKEFPLRKIEKEWLLATEIIRRGINEDEKVRETVQPLVTSPLSESLPNELIEIMPREGVERFGQLLDKYPELSKFLKLPPVPDELIDPDLYHAKQLYNPEELVAQYKQHFPDQLDFLKDLLRKNADFGHYTKGVTPHEKKMIAMRYRLARDTKLLALGADILQEEDIGFDEQGQATLKSGVSIVIDKDFPDAKALLNPHEWEKRRQLKDRVHEISVGVKKYILKEKKTKMHTDTIEGGHREGISSREEFEAAKYFNNLPTQEHGDIVINWEKPIGTVEFPDGYQFCIFQYEEDLIGDNDICKSYSEEIKNNRKQYEEEYNRINANLDKYIQNPLITRYHKKDQNQVTTLPFDDFAKMKAWRSYWKAMNVLKQTAIEHGYDNRDMDGFAFKILHDDKGVRLGIVGFDFEYFKKVDEKEKTEMLAKHKKSTIELESYGIGFGSGEWWDGKETTLAQRAAYLAMLDEDGLLKKD